MKVKNFRKMSNLIIIFMFTILLIYMGASNYEYVFSYQNEDVIYNGNREKNNISLMFNVYWGTEYIGEILEVLDRYNAKCTFFIGGSWAEKNIDILNQIVSCGHEIGSHGYFHKEHEFLDYEQNYEEINVTHNLVKTLTNIEMSLFAPPSGSFNKATLQACNEQGYSLIMWSKDTIDWRDKDANLIYKRATNNIVGGDFILAHPTEDTLKALPLILEYYKLNNFNVLTVSDCLQ